MAVSVQYRRESAMLSCVVPVSGHAGRVVGAGIQKGRNRDDCAVRDPDRRNARMDEKLVSFDDLTDRARAVLNLRFCHRRRQRRAALGCTLGGGRRCLRRCVHRHGVLSGWGFVPSTRLLARWSPRVRARSCAWSPWTGTVRFCRPAVAKPRAHLAVARRERRRGGAGGRGRRGSRCATCCRGLLLRGGSRNRASSHWTRSAGRTPRRCRRIPPWHCEGTLRVFGAPCATP